MSGIFDGFSEHYDETARLTILKALAEQTDFRLNETMIQAALESFAFRRGRDYLRNQLRWLEHSAGAVKLREVGTVLIAELTEAGMDHVERRRVLEGVRRPSPMRG